MDEPGFRMPPEHVDKCFAVIFSKIVEKKLRTKVACVPLFHLYTFT